MLLNNSMRALLFLVLVLELMLDGVNVNGESNTLRDVRLIRRAYIDVSGYFPTPEEIDWFVVYNNNGYEMAVDHLISKYAPQCTKQQLMSDEYIHQHPRDISVVILRRSLLYSVGLNPNKDTLQQGKDRLLNISLACADNESDVIDYMCNIMMSRTANVEESNKLLQLFRNACALSNENTAWMRVIDEIMNLPGVCTK